MKNLIILGAGGHGKVVADIARKNGYINIAFLDDNREIKECLGYPVIGDNTDFYSFKENSNFFIAIGNSIVRESYFKQLESSGCNIIKLLHPNAQIGANVEIGCGSVVMAGAVINPSTIIGKGCIINTCSSIDHDCIIGNYSHVSVGAHLAGTITVGNSTWIGIGAVVTNNIHIASGCIIGAGSVVIDNILEKGTYVGVPARKIK